MTIECQTFEPQKKNSSDTGQELMWFIQYTVHVRCVFPTIVIPCVVHVVADGPNQDQDSTDDSNSDKNGFGDNELRNQAGEDDEATRRKGCQTRGYRDRTYAQAEESLKEAAREQGADAGYQSKACHGDQWYRDTVSVHLAIEVD